MTGSYLRAPELSKALQNVRQSLWSIGLFSCLVNLLMLTGPIFMLQVYDRVLASGSVHTLVALSVLAGALYLFMGILDLFRSRLLIAVGHRFEQSLGSTAFANDLQSAALKTAETPEGTVMKDVRQLRSFLGSQGVVAFFDLPWMPVYLGIVFMLHVSLGLVGLAGAAVLVAVAIVADIAVRRAAPEFNAHLVQSKRISDAGHRSSEAIKSMGMQANVTAMWEKANTSFLGASSKNANLIAVSSTVTKTFRLMLQSLMLAVGAYLAIKQLITPGAMIAASIILARGLQPIETAVQHLRGLLSAQRAYKSLNRSLSTAPGPDRIQLPDAKKDLSVDGIAVVPPGAGTPNLLDVRFRLDAGEALGVIGQTGGGKSTLARALVGIWPCVRGTVSLDAVPLDQWIPENLGRQIGYLPQDVELLDGTIAENIARFDPDATDAMTVAAAKAAGVHDMITGFEGGYGASVGEGGTALSGGQRQRIALARALYGNPFLIVLDEPNSNLDADGEIALHKAIRGARARGAIVVIVAHRPSALNATDKLIVLNGGRVSQFGPRDEILSHLRQGHPGTQTRSAASGPRTDRTISQTGTPSGPDTVAQELDEKNQAA